MFRISSAGQEPVTDVDKLDQIEQALQALGPVRHHVDQIKANPLPCGHTSRRWGVRIKKHDGSVTLEPDPWPS
jgi:hypothetical protein